MKRHLSLTITILMFVAAMATPAQARVFGSHQVKARIPFSFNVGKTNLPAGEYTVTVLNPASDRKILQIRSIDGRRSALVHTTGMNTNNSEKAKLVFNRYGDRYFFAQAQMAGDSATLAAVKSSVERLEERALAKQLAGAAYRSSQLVCVLLR